jgi:hypothetical protein
MTQPAPLDRRTARGISVIAAVTAVAPFVVQTGTLVLTRSDAWTLVAGLLLAGTFALAALAFQARQVGGWKRIGVGAAAAIVAAVLAYHVIAYPVAHILEAMFFAGSGR